MATSLALAVPFSTVKHEVGAHEDGVCVLAALPLALPHRLRE